MIQKQTIFLIVLIAAVHTITAQPLYEMPKLPQSRVSSFGWVNFYRIDDYSAVSYFYLNKPVSKLPSLPSPDLRIKNVR